MKYQLNIFANAGYGANQVTSITVGELKEMLDGLEDDAEIITYDSSNGYGAAYGRILRGYVDESESEEDNE